MPRGAETARCHVVQRDRATLQRAEKPRDATSCRGTARRYSVQRNRATSYRAEGPRTATACRYTLQCHVLPRDRTTPRGAEGPCDATWCRETARRYSVQRKIVQIEVVLRPRRRPIDHRALWTGVGANRTRPAHPAGHSTPTNRLRIR